MIISTTRHLICFQVSQSNSNNERQWPLAVECKKRRQLEIKLHFHVWCTKKTQTPQSWCKNCSEITLQPWHDPETGGLDRSLQIFISQHVTRAKHLYNGSKRIETWHKQACQSWCGVIHLWKHICSRRRMTDGRLKLCRNTLKAVSAYVAL